LLKSDRGFNGVRRCDGSCVTEEQRQRQRTRREKKGHKKTKNEKRDTVHLFCGHAKMTEQGRGNTRALGGREQRFFVRTERNKYAHEKAPLPRTATRRNNRYRVLPVFGR